MGLYADDGALIAVCNMADTYKPTLAEGSGRTQTLRMVITVTDTGAVSLTMDDTLIIATEEYVNDLLAAHEKSRNHPDGTLTEKGFLQLSSSVNSTSETLAATPKAVKAANDNANGRLSSGGTAVAANKLATTRKIAGVDFDGTKNITIVAGDVGALPITGGTVTGPLEVNSSLRAGSISIGSPAQGEFVTHHGINIGDSDSGLISTTDGSVSFFANGVNKGHWDYTALRYEGDITAAGSMSSTGDIHSERNIHNAGVIQAGTGVYDTPNVRVYSPNNKPNAADVGAVQQGGAPGMTSNNVVHIGWSNSGLRAQVDNTPMGAIYCEYHKPTPDEIGAIREDGCRYAGFVANNAAVPYMRHTSSDAVVALAPTAWVGEQVSAVRQWANGDLRNEIINWGTASFVNSIARGAQSSMVMDGGLVEAPAGCVLTGGNGNEGNQVGYALYRPLQMRRNSTWLTIEG